MREQLKFLEGIDRVHTKRKQEQEREKLLKAAKVNYNQRMLIIDVYTLPSMYVYYWYMPYYQCMLIIGICFTISVCLLLVICFTSILIIGIRLTVGVPFIIIMFI